MTRNVKDYLLIWACVLASSVVILVGVLLGFVASGYAKAVGALLIPLGTLSYVYVFSMEDLRDKSFGFR